MAEKGTNRLNDLMSLTMEKIREMADSNTIIGNPITMQDGTTIIPVSRVTFGFASGGSDVGAKASKEMFGGGSGAGISISPVAFLVISPSGVRTMQLMEHAGTIDNAISALPELVDKLSAMLGRGKPSRETAKEAAKEAFEAAEKADAAADQAGK